MCDIKIVTTFSGVLIDQISVFYRLQIFEELFEYVNNILPLFQILNFCFNVQNFWRRAGFRWCPADFLVRFSPWDDNFKREYVSPKSERCTWKPFQAWFASLVGRKIPNSKAGPSRGLWRYFLPRFAGKGVTGSWSSEGCCRHALQFSHRCGYWAAHKVLILK